LNCRDDWFQQALIFLRDPTARQPGARSGDVSTQQVLVFVTAMLVPLVALTQTAPPAQPFQRLDGCVYKSQRWNDGDSFHVLLRDQKEVIFRLYFAASGQ
jgi:hypothetical protein